MTPLIRRTGKEDFSRFLVSVPFMAAQVWACESGLLYQSIRLGLKTIGQWSLSCPSTYLSLRISVQAKNSSLVIFNLTKKPGLLLPWPGWWEPAATYPGHQLPSGPRHPRWRLLCGQQRWPGEMNFIQERTIHKSMDGFWAWYYGQEICVCTVGGWSQR